MDYKSSFTHLQLLPPMYRLELNDIVFFVNSLANLDNLGHFDIMNYVSFSDSNTRSSSASKLKHNTCAWSLIAMARKKRSCDAAFKLKVVEYVEKGTNRDAASKFSVDEKSVREWRKKKTDLLSIPDKKRRLRLNIPSWKKS